METNYKKRKLEENDVHHPHTKRRKIEFDHATNIDLPAEIMLEIFEKLSPTDYKTSLEVCKYWYDCSSTFIGWVFLGATDFDVYRSTLPPKYEEEEGISVMESRWGPLYTKPYSVECEGSELLLSADKHKHFGRITVGLSAWSTNIIANYLRDNPCASRREWRMEAYRLHIPKAAHPSIVMKLYLNARALEDAVTNGEISTFPKLELIWKYGVNAEVPQVIQKESKPFKEFTTAIMPYIPPKINAPAGLKEGFKWHRYQLECISWMKSIEENTDKEFKYCDLVPWRASRSHLLFDLHNQKIVTPEAASEYIGSFKSRGGILADAVGLGKTLEVIGLVLATKESRTKTPEYDENGLFKTNATLVFCLSHIALQWSSEIAKFTDLKVTQITNMTEANEVTYGDIVKSDFVIVAVNLIKSKPFISLGVPKSKAMNSFAAKAMKVRAEHMRNFLEEVKAKKYNVRQNSLQVQGPPLDNFHFRRIIVDEAHEVFGDNFMLTYLTNQTTSACWYVSATPFPSDGLFEAVKKFLGIWEPDFNFKKTDADIYESFVENDLIMNNLVWRNTKESIQDEYEVPDYEEHVEWVECHPIETLYHKYCGSVENLASLDERKKREIESLERQIQYYYYHNNQATYKSRIKEWKKVPNVITASASGEELEKLKLRNENGSKVAQVVAWLKERMEENESNRFLFFTRNHMLLSRLTRVFREQNIPAVSFEGNVHQKVKKLQEFKDDNVRVMLLSLVKSASGLNLIEANHIVLLDPMSGSVEESRAYELQALGRAHRQGQDQKVQLVRFVMQGTQEEEVYHRNKSSGRGPAVQNPSLKRSSSAVQMLNRSSSAASLRQLAEKEPSA